MKFLKLWDLSGYYPRGVLLGVRLPKMSISGQIVSEIVAQLCLEDPIQTLLNFLGVDSPPPSLLFFRALFYYLNAWNRLTETKGTCKQTQHWCATTPNIVGCYMLRPFALPVACCWMLLRVVAQSLKPVKLFSQQLPKFLLFRDHRSLAQQCWIRLHSSSNIVGSTHAHYACST